MTVVYRWLTEDQSIMSFVFQTQANWDDFYNVCYPALEALDHPNKPVDMIIDVSRMSSFPRETLKELLYITQYSHVNLRYRIIISQNALFLELFKAFQRSYPIASQKLVLCHTMEDVHFVLDHFAPPR